MITIFVISFVLSVIAIIIKLTNSKITWLNVGCQILGILFITVIGYFISVSTKTYDTEIISGKVVGKSREIVSCSHSYPCRCRQSCSGYGKSRSCSTVCDTCYSHSFDVDWDVKSTIGTFTINRKDSQGLIEPERWTKVETDEPVSKEISYTNYIKAVPDSLYSQAAIDPQVAKIEYPNKVYDYYKVDRVVDVDLGLSKKLVKSLNEKISNDLKDIAAKKQVNLVIVFTKNTNAMFAEHLKNAWLGGKKNDLVLVVGSTKFPEIAWVSAFGWSRNNMVNINVRDAVREYGKIDEHIVTLAIKGINKYWDRNRMRNFQYLENEIEPNTTAFVIISIVGLIGVIGSSILIIKKE
jgi:hypothetical protein